MNIGIDIRVLGSRTKSGIEEYTENLVQEMLTLDSGIKYKFFYTSHKNRLPDYEWLQLSNVQMFDYKIPSKVLFASSYIFNSPKIDELIEGADVFFSPHFLRTPLSGQCRRVTTFHDLSYVHYPDFFSWQGRLWHGIGMRPSVQSRFTDKIIAVSESTQKDLISQYDIDPAKIKVIYSGIAKDIFRPDEESLKKFRKENNLPQKFILYLGKLEPRKNIVNLIRAFNIVQSKMKDTHLVIAGSKGWLYEDIFKEIGESPANNKIIVKDYVPNDLRSYYYALASVFAYPSFFEGFGFPPLEAMACGTPVVVSNRSSLPEVVGKCALMINPGDTNELADALLKILRDKELRITLSERGIIKSREFNWKKTAEETLEYILK